MSNAIQLYTYCILDKLANLHARYTTVQRYSPMTWCGMQRKTDGKAPSNYIYASSGKISYANIVNTDQKRHARSLISIFVVFYSQFTVGLLPLSNYIFSLIYRSGRKYLDDDALSRLPSDNKETLFNGVIKAICQGVLATKV